MDETGYMVLNRKLPVIYRWVRRWRYFSCALVLSCALVFLPAGFIGGVKLSRVISVNRALAATLAFSPERPVVETMSDDERRHYAQALSGLVTDRPDKILQLVGQDLLIVFRDPDLRRADGGSSMWQYRTEACVLDIYFTGGDESAVSHYEIRPRKIAVFTSEDKHDGAVDAAGCLKSITKQAV
jgi:hypothetical protein